MKTHNFLSRLTPGFVLAAMLGGALAMPTTASAHEIVSEKRDKVVRTTDHHERHHRDFDHWYLARHREVASRWAPSHRGHKHHHRCKHRRGHKYGHRRQHHHDRQGYGHQQSGRHLDRPNRYHDLRHDGVRVHIDYDFVL